MAVIDKSKIIEAIQQTDNEWVLLAINRLLQIEEEELGDCQKQLLDKRNERIDAGLEELHNWDDMKKEIERLD